MRIAKAYGFALFTALLIIIILFSFSITPQYISDIYASSYVIIPILMLPIFSIFMLKHSDDIIPEVDLRSFAMGFILFLFFVSFVLNARGYLGPLFFSYRIDMLAVPIAIIALACLIFGLRNLERFAWIAIYALFASPVLLLPVINANLGFASINTAGIYLLAKPFLAGLSFIRPITLYFNGYGVSIGNTCIGIGAIIGMVMLMLPIAYFLEGKGRRKALWVGSGVLLLLALNFIRMLLITFAWFEYGPSNEILGVHAVAGQIIFYASVLVMIMIPGKYGLSYPRLKLGKGKARYNALAVASAVIISLLYFSLAASFSGASAVPVESLAGNVSFSPVVVSHIYDAYINYSGTPYVAIGMGNLSADIIMPGTNGSANTTVILGQGDTNLYEAIGNESDIAVQEEFMAGYNVSHLYRIGQEGPWIYYTVVPYYDGQDVQMVSMYIIGYGRQISGAPCIGPYDRLYDYASNLAALNINLFNSDAYGNYCYFKRLLK